MLRAAIALVTRLWRRPAERVVSEPAGGADEDARHHFRDGLMKSRAGDREGALAALDRAIALDPELADAVMTRAEVLDSLGRTEEAREGYERARRIWSDMPSGAADRRYVFRRRGKFAFEIEAYELVRTNVRSKILPQLAHGNALLAIGKAAKALDSYERALKVDPKQNQTLALKGEALSALGRYEEAIQLFDSVLAANPRDVETLNARGIARLALGRLAEANEDWGNQLAALPPTSSAARGCVAMRLGNHSVAHAEFGLAHAKEPGNSYWLLYRASAARLAGLTGEPLSVPAGDGWPARLIGFLAGEVSEERLIEQATSRSRLTEARFQMGVVAAETNPAAARRLWKDVVQEGAPAMIEVAAASNALARFGA